MGSSVAVGSNALIKGALPKALLSEGSKIRILDVGLIESTDDQQVIDTPVFQLTTQSEVFFLPNDTEPP